MDLKKLNQILKNFVTKTGGVRDAVLVSHEAKLITNPMGEWDEDSIAGMATAMFFLTDSTRKHLGWSPLEQMWLQAEENYFIGIRCDNEVFLLVKAINKNNPLGGLRMEINPTVKELKTVLNSEVILTEEKKGMWRNRKIE